MADSGNCWRVTENTRLILAAAYIKLRNDEASRGQQGQTDKDNVRRLVGSIRQIQERAPRALRAVQDMPQVNDTLQQRLLGSQQ